MNSVFVEKCTTELLKLYKEQREFEGILNTIYNYLLVWIS